MPRVAKAVLKKKETFPWYEWVEEFEWDDDEFQGPVLSSDSVRGKLGKYCGADFSRYNWVENSKETNEVGTV